MKVNLVGSSTFNLGSLLWRYGHQAYHDCINPECYDLTVVGGLWHLPEANYDKPVVALAVGSDVYNQLEDRRTDLISEVDLVLMAHETMFSYLREYIALNNVWDVWKMPFDSLHFLPYKYPVTGVVGKVVPFFTAEKRDTLLYCLSPGHSDPNRYVDFIRDNPFKKITFLGPVYQDLILEKFDNVMSIRRVPWGCMPYLYRMHKEYRLFYSIEDTISIMVCEALYMGLRAFGNDVEIHEIPENRFENVAIPKFIEYMESILCQ